MEVRLYIEVSLYQNGSFSLVCCSLPLLMVSKEIIDKKKIENANPINLYDSKLLIERFHLNCSSTIGFR